MDIEESITHGKVSMMNMKWFMRWKEEMAMAERVWERVDSNESVCVMCGCVCVCVCVGVCVCVWGGVDLDKEEYIEDMACVCVCVMCG